MRRIRKTVAWILAVLMIFSLTSCGRNGKKQNGQTSEQKALNIQCSTVNGTFSPFYAGTIADRDVMELTQVRLLSNDRAGAVICHGIEGETHPYNGTDYTYYGPANVEVTENPDGSVWYDFTLRENMKFSDGTPITIDDLIFSIYVLCDPAYNGPNCLREMPIEGLDRYRQNQASLSYMLAQLGENNTDFSIVEEEKQSAFWNAVNHGLVDFVQKVMEGLQTQEDVAASKATEEEPYIPVQYTPSRVAVAYGWADLPADATLKDLAMAMGTYFRWDFEKIDEYFESQLWLPGIEIPDLPELLGDVYTYSNEIVSSGTHASQISGIQKTGTYSLRVVASHLDVSMIYYLGSIYIAPIHYYGDASLYDYENSMFGFTKGDLSGIQSKNGEPMGAGPYRFLEFEDQTITYRANESYYLGKPKIETINLKPDGAGTDYSLSEDVMSGKLDVAFFNSGNVEEDIAEGNARKEQIWAEYLESETRLQYTYIGINPNEINVAGDPGSEESKNLRRAFATLFTAYRRSGIEENIAMGDDTNYRIHDYPVACSCWVLPGMKDPQFEKPYSKDKFENDLYTDGMTDEERQDAALQAALGFFEAAGYTVENGVLIQAPEGATLEYEALLWLTEEDPMYLTVRSVQKVLADIGMDLKITNTMTQMLEDETGTYVVPEKGEGAIFDGLWDVSQLANARNGYNDWKEWYVLSDPNLFLSEIYYSDLENGRQNPGSMQPVCGIEDQRLDALILEGRNTLDQQKREEIYQECMEIISDWSCEVPCYRYVGEFVVNTEKISAESVPTDTTVVYSWTREIQNMEFN